MQSRKNIMTFVILGVILLCLTQANCQVTFSRDWNAGKRSVPECFVSIKSAASLCQILINELRGIAACEMRSLISKRPEEMENAQDIFSTTHTG